MNGRFRKQVYELTPEDLDRSSIWEFALPAYNMVWLSGLCWSFAGGRPADRQR